MFAKCALPRLGLAVASQVSAHGTIPLALGVSGTPTLADVQRPSTNAPCGNINVTQTIGTATPIQAAADGTFNATVINFTSGADGSRSVSAMVDAAATGNAGNFVAAQVTKNDDPAPTDLTTEQITAVLPAGTTCTGGGKGLCLVSLTTTAGFGNCVVVQQAAAAAAGTTAAGNAAGAGAVAAAAALPAATPAAAAAGTTGKKHHKGGKKAAAKAAAAAAAPATNLNATPAATPAANATLATNQANATPAKLNATPATHQPNATPAANQAKALAKRVLALRFARHLTERDE